MVPDENSMEDSLCNSSFGSMVSLDYDTPDTERGYCIRWVAEGQCAFGEACAFKHDPNKKV